MMDEKTLEEELAKSFENARADESNVMDCYGVRAVLRNSVLGEFESRHPEILTEDDDDLYYSNLSKLTHKLDEMYGSISFRDLGVELDGILVVFPEDRSKINSSQVLLKKLTCVMRDLESAINDAYEDDNGDIRDYFEEAQRLVEAMQSISSRAEGKPEK